ncbi:serine/threonine-protein kinase M1, partial [Rhizopus stolonifer]
MLLMSSHPPLNSQAMDIDQDVSGTAALLRSDLLNGNVRNRVQTIVNHLTSTQTKDDQNHNLIEQIREISIQTGNTDVSVLFYSKMKQIVQFVTRILSVDSDLAGNISELFGYDIPQFLLHNMHFALYYAITCHDQHVLANLALALETKVVTLCQQNGHHIIIALTMEEDQTVAQSVIERLIKILRVKEPIRHLAQKHMTKITISLAMNLGDVKQKQKAIDALRNMSHITNVKLSEHLSLYMLGILEKVNGYISTKRNGNQKIHYPFALESMIEIMVLLDEKLENYILHLIKLFQGVNKLSGMQSQALSLWTMFISCVTKNILAQHLSTITQSLIDLFRVSEAKIRQKVIQTLENLLVTGYTFEANQYSNLPLLPQFKEFNALKQHIKVKATSANPQTLYKQELEHILKDLCEADDMPIQIALDKLQKLLTDYPNESLQLETLYSRLLYILHKYATHKPISLKAAICLGKLGALDPGLISVSTIDDTVFIMNNFRREDEVGEFVCDLITNYLYPAHNASNDNNMRACIEYAIKPLLDCARFQPIENMTKSDERVNPAAYRWRKLPNSIQQFIAPFFVAAYEATWETHTSAYPIFAKAQNFKGWLQAWFLRMVHSSEGVAKEVFQAFIPIVKSNMLDITRHLIPYLVLHNLLSGSPEDIRGIIDELMNVIHVNANLNPHHDLGKNTFNHYALQVCVETTEYCRKWLNRVGRNDLEKESQVKRINTFLQEIPRRDMGIAAFHTKAYPQALMQFETFIKEKKNGQLDHDIMDYLRQIYIQIEDPIDLKVLMDTYTTVLTLDERITRYESLGRWDQAQVLYKGKIREKDSDLSAYMGYMECLRKSGSYDKMIYEADTMLHDLPRWLPNINSYKIDAAWRLQNWDKLDQTVSLPIHRDIPALIGCILNDMRKKNYTDAASCIEEARYKVIEQLTISHSKSYRKSYPLLFDLQLLQELEESQKIWELTDPTEDLNKLEQRWKKTFKNIIPHAQYQLNLLQLRKAAYFDIRPTNQFSVNAHQTWLAIAKINRKAGNMTLAADAIQQAEEQSKQTLYRDRAKWLWKDGYPKEAAELLLSKINHGGVGFEEALLYVEIDLENDLEGDAKSMVKIINREGQFDGEKVTYYQRIEHKILVMRSLQMPKRITIVGSDGKLYKFLVKKEDDLRKDARTMEFSNMINTFLRKNPQARDSGLYIRTFAVVPLGHRWGLIEWIDNLNALKAIVNDYWSIGAKLEKIKLGRVPEKLQVFERCLANSPSVFYKWFLKNFPEPNQWLNSRTRYIKTLAVMSIVGYCIGLGDRHAENIMFDQTNGDCVHVDLNMLFESGSGLPTPEIVPFRLTHNLVDALGVLGYKGIFQHTCELTLQVLLNNREALLAVFETHINEIESARNNGSRNILRVSGSKATQDMIRLRTKFDTKPEQINSEVNRLIKEATSKENLCQMYH